LIFYILKLAKENKKMVKNVKITKTKTKKQNDNIQEQINQTSVNHMNKNLTWNRVNYKNFEYYTMTQHQKETSQNTFHWDHVPESVLFDSGFIQNFRDIRMKRKGYYDMEGKYYNVVREYGLDGISFDTITSVYHGIQCKLWNHPLNINDLNTFFNKMNDFRNKNPNSKGYLYHTSSIDSSVRESDDYTLGYIFQEKIEYNESIQKSFLGIESVDLNDINESTFLLRDYQKEAIEALDQEEGGIGLLNLPCGTGKTLIFCNHAKNKQYKNVFIISPLQVHAKQNLKRMKNFLAEYDSLLLDSDSGGSTNFEDLENILHKKSIISTTFDSAKNVLKQMFYLNDNYQDDEYSEYSEYNEDMEDTYYETDFDLSNSIVIVDEAHNLINNDELIKIIRSFPNVLLVTATPPSCMEELLGCKLSYQYSFKRAIDENHICDYRVYIPLLIKNEVTGVSSVLIENPSELMDLDDDLSKKCLYLINGMLQTGSRKCIAYLSSQEECDAFQNVFKEVIKRYHYIPYWIGMITSLIGDKERQSVLSDFQKDNEDTINILCSIRILDEGIDIPNCDSIFVSNVAEKASTIRMVQRICRANRKVCNHPNKIANCFLWTNDVNSILDTLTLLKENDIEFHTKIRVMNGDYEKQDTKERIEITNKQNKEIGEYVRVKCMNRDEIWEMKKQILFEFCDENNQVPTRKKQFKGINIGKWLSHQKDKINSIKDDIYIKLSLNDYIKNALDKYLEEKYKKNNKIEYTIEQKKEFLLKYVIKNEKVPSRSIIDENNCNLGYYYLGLKHNVKNNKSKVYKEFEEYEIIKNDFNRLIQEKETNKNKISFTYDQKKELLLKYIEDNKKVPTRSITIIEKNDFKLGIFYTSLKQKVKNNQSEVYKEFEGYEIIKNDFDRCIKKKKKIKIE
jgi:superfamily II DNA or RNA helicase